MKRTIFAIVSVCVCTMPCSAQFSLFKNISKTIKNAKQERMTEKQFLDKYGNQTYTEFMQNHPVEIDTTSAEFRQARAKAQAEAQQHMYNNPQLKKIMELQGDTAALNKYMREQYGNISYNDHLNRADKAMKSMGQGIDMQDVISSQKALKNIEDDPIIQKIKAEGREPTKEETEYIRNKYFSTFAKISPEFDGMEAYYDSVGVYARLEGTLKPIGYTTHDKITEIRPVLDLGQDEIKQYVKDVLASIKNPLADRVIVDSIQNYFIYDKSHADEQFKGAAKFTIYSNNAVVNNTEWTMNDALRRRVTLFEKPVDLNNIFVFKVHRGVGCRYMDYMYSKITYKQSELTDYVSKRLVDEKYIDANCNGLISDEQLFETIDKLQNDFKKERLSEIIGNNEKFIYTNKVTKAPNVKMTSNTRCIVEGHVTAQDITIEAAPGEYAFIIRDPQIEKSYKDFKEEHKNSSAGNIDISLLSLGAIFFTIK